MLTLFWIATVIQIIILLFIIIRILKMPGSIHRSMAAVFFLFGSISFVFSNIYWIVFDALRPDVRMPFAANEFGEAAIYLLYGSVLAVSLPKNGRFFSKEILLTVLFSAANIILWIGWSGEWLQDILGGLAFGYFLCMAVQALKHEQAFSSADWHILGIGSAVLIALQAGTFFAPDTVRAGFDLCAYILMTAVGVFFVIKGIRAFLKKQSPGILKALSFAGFGWSTTCLYMSTDPWYTIAMCAGTFMLLLALDAIGKEVREA